MVPTSRLVLLWLLPLSLGVIAPFEPRVLTPMLALDALFLGLCLVDAVAGRRRLLRVEREAPRVLSIGRENPVRLEIVSRASRPLVVWVRDDLPPELTSTDLPVRVVVPPHAHVRATYHVRPQRRGAYHLGAQHIRYATPLGLWRRQLRQDTELPLRVYPDVRAVRTYELLARQNRETLMARAARLRGGENEFERLRDHQRDDPFRAIDWKATARRHKMTVREYQKERDQSVMCLLDCGRLMTAETAGLSQLDHALNATLMLGHVAARSGDHVGLLAFDSEVRRYLAPLGGARAAQRLAVASYDLHPSLVETDYGTAFATLSRRLRKRSLVVLFTQVVDEVEARALVKLVRGFPSRHLVLCVLFRDAEIDALADAPVAPAVTTGRTGPGSGPDGPADIFLRAAAAEIVMWREQVARELKTLGALVLHTPAGTATPSLINKYLEIKARQLL